MARRVFAFTSADTVAPVADRIGVKEALLAAVETQVEDASTEQVAGLVEVFFAGRCSGRASPTSLASQAYDLCFERVIANFFSDLKSALCQAFLFAS